MVEHDRLIQDLRMLVRRWDERVASLRSWGHQATKHGAYRMASELDSQAHGAAVCYAELRQLLARHGVSVDDA